ncbi:hypothetical protein A2U01_0107435, partial [Trifolium medium]|nr:hypothetical protein [Trifolium medium]
RPYRTRGAEARVTHVTRPCKSYGAGARLAHATMFAQDCDEGQVEV